MLAMKMFRFDCALGDNMTATISPENLSRIDKLLLDRDAADPLVSQRRRADRGFAVAAGDDVVRSYDLQLMLLTAVNLAVRTFGGICTVHATAEFAASQNLIPTALGVTLGEAVKELGGRIETAAALTVDKPYLLLGSGAPIGRALRATFDGWRIAVGPAAELPRLPERSFCPLAGAAAAAIGVGEIFAEFAAISITATRRVVIVSLWRPDVGHEDPVGVGQLVAELPNHLALFGLGHLGQAYLWAYAALRHQNPALATLTLCDDDIVEKANLETGAIVSPFWLDKLKSRMAMHWLEKRAFNTRLLERRVDASFRRAQRDSVIALSGFDDNQPRQWLSSAGFTAMFDSGLGGEAANFDTIAYKAWPNIRAAAELWPIETNAEIVAREARRRKIIREDAYRTLDADECGRLLLAGKSVAVPFVGTFAACMVLAELLKAVNGGPVFHEIKLSLCALDQGRIHARLAAAVAPPMRGFSTQSPQT